MMKQHNSLKFEMVDNERGFVLVITMLILVVLTIVGMAALDSSMFEVKIASNDRLAKVAFNLADGAVYSSSKLVTEAMEDGADPGYALVDFQAFNRAKDGVAVTNDPDDFYKRVMGFMPIQPTNPDFQIKPNGSSASAIIEGRLAARETKMIAGGGVEFGAGAAGAGSGSGGGGAAVTFDIDIEGYAGNNSRSFISARYRKVLGASGGM